MANINNKAIALARIYANAILELAESQSAADGLRDELLELGKYLETHPEVAEFFASPTVDTSERRDFIEKSFRGRVSELLADSLQVINRKDRLGLLEVIVEQYRQAHAELRGCVDVLVRSAVTLDDTQRVEIRKAALQYSGKKPELVEMVDPDMLGGLIIQIGDLKFDDSVATRLHQMSTSLAERGAKEIHSGKLMAYEET